VTDKGKAYGVDFRARMKLSSDTKYDVSCKEGRAHVQGDEQAQWHVERKGVA